MIAKDQILSKQRLLELCLVFFITTLAYLPVLFNFFLGDDFVHLSWLSKCIHAPSLLLRNFNHSWLEVVTTKFYRPLISVFMFTDYLLWRANGLGFHLTNICFHLTNCLFVYLLTEFLARPKSTARRAKCAYMDIPSWPLLAALLFGLYPLHPEAVSWITGRVDTIVTTFYLAALWFYIQWREKQRAPYFVLSMVSAILALLSKEMAITIPFALLAWEWFQQKQSQLDKIKTSLIYTSPFWLLLVLYFGVRLFALGTFVGGYDDSLLFIPDLRAHLKGWIHSIGMTLLPINRTVTSQRNVLAIGWCVGMLVALCGIIKSALNRTQRRISTLLIALIVISLVPVYKVFGIADDLESSRLVYLTSSFLCMLLGFGIVVLTRTELSEEPGRNTASTKLWLTIGQALVVAIFFISAFGLLYRNNLVWREAGLESRAIRTDLERITKSLPEHAHLLLIGLPDQWHGAYICRNAAPGIVEPPQFPKLLSDCIFLNSFDPVFPFGYLKHSLQQQAENVNIFSWNRGSQKFDKVVLPATDDPSRATQSGQNNNRLYKFGSDPLPCWNSDFVFFSIPPRASDMRDAPNRPDKPDTRNAQNAHNAPNAVNTQNMVSQPPTVRFQNSICNTPDCDNQIQTFITAVGHDNGAIASLRSSPIWACGGQGTLSLPNSTSKSDSASFAVLPCQILMPSLDFANSGYLGSKGFLHLSPSHASEILYCRQNDVQGADHFSLEILRPNVFLNPGEQNGTEPSRQKLKEISATGRTGTLPIKVTDFPSAGLYQARFWATDKTGRHLGVAGDHIIISIDP